MTKDELVRKLKRVNTNVERLERAKNEIIQSYKQMFIGIFPISSKDDNYKISLMKINFLRKEKILVCTLKLENKKLEEQFISEIELYRMDDNSFKPWMLKQIMDTNGSIRENEMFQEKLFIAREKIKKALIKKKNR